MECLARVESVWVRRGNRKKGGKGAGKECGLIVLGRASTDIFLSGRQKMNRMLAGSGG